MCSTYLLTAKLYSDTSCIVDAFGGYVAYIAMNMKALVMLLVCYWLPVTTQGAYLYSNIDSAVSVLVLAWHLTVMQNVSMEMLGCVEDAQNQREHCVSAWMES